MRAAERKKSRPAAYCVMPKPKSIFVNRQVPLYYQLENLLREKINSGKFSPGDRLPTESDFIEEYQVSRITVRQALGALAADGLIERRQGFRHGEKRTPPSR